MLLEGGLPISEAITLERKGGAFQKTAMTLRKRRVGGTPLLVKKGLMLLFSQLSLLFCEVSYVYSMLFKP